MIRHSPTSLDDRADSRQAPSLGLEARPFGPSGENGEQLLPLGGPQPRGTSRLGMTPQSRQPTLAVAELLGPLTDGGGSDTNASSDLGLRKTAGAEQATGRETALFDLIGSEFAWSPHSYKSNAQGSGC